MKIASVALGMALARGKRSCFADGFKENGDEKISDTINVKTEKLISLLKNGIGNY